MQLSTLVILYNATILDSTTLQTLLDCQLADHKLTLHIWNNGPKALEQPDIDAYLDVVEGLGVTVHIYEDIRNLALSKIYNFIINKGAFDFFIPFDQDSCLNKDFFITVADYPTLDLILPRVENNGKTKFPYYVKQGPINEEGKVEVNRVTSINSGMAISSHLVKIFQDSGLTVFDERFAFYGIDTAFFLNLWELYHQYPIISCGCYGKIEHSLAMDEEEATQGKLSDNRRLEYLYFFILYRLHYKHRSKLSILYHMLNKIWKSNIRSKENLSKIIKCILLGQHPRSAMSIKESQVQ